MRLLKVQNLIRFSRRHSLKFQSNTGSRTEFTGDLHLCIMQIDDLTGDGEAQSCAPVFDLMRLVHFVKAFPNIREILNNAASVILVHNQPTYDIC